MALARAGRAPWAGGACAPRAEATARCSPARCSPARPRVRVRRARGAAREARPSEPGAQPRPQRRAPPTSPPRRGL
eukprot:4613109-Alexandrium_andersonii.AAC.1